MLLITFEVAVLALDETRDVHAATLEQCDSTYLAYAHSHFWFLASRPAIAPPNGLPRQEILTFNVQVRQRVQQHS